jgi:hypothetical protein
MADLRGCGRFRPEAALTSGKLTRGGTGGQPTHRKSLCLGSDFQSLLETQTGDLTPWS